MLKYGRMKALAGPLSDLLARALPRDEQIDCIVPVPLHWMRQWQRGFNQSELLARAIARRCGLPLVRGLRRARSTPAQAGLSLRARRRNVSAAFRPSVSQSVAGKRVLLVDDVLTTGATASACARVLKRAGAERVAVLTVARADRRFEAVGAF